MLLLLATYGDEEWAFMVPEGEARLGSSLENDLVLPVRGVSRRHLLLRRTPGGVELEDLGSKNRIFVAGQKVERTLLTPGLRVQIGKAWLELEEASSSEAALALCASDSPEWRELASRVTSTENVQVDDASLPSPEAALRLACHIDQAGVGRLGERPDLLARIHSVLGAEGLLLFEWKQKKIAVCEGDGDPIANECSVRALLSSMLSSNLGEELKFRRSGRFLLAGRGRWFLALRFAGESLVREGWRRTFVRFLARHLLPSSQSMRERKAAALREVIGQTGRNVDQTAKLLDIRRPTVYAFLKKSEETKAD